MAIQGNAFALLDDDDAENLLARLSTAAVEAPPAVDKGKPKNKKHVASSPPSSQFSTAAPQHSSDQEKGRQGTERYNRNGFGRQTRTDGKGYNNRDGVERHTRNGVEANGGQENSSRQNSRGAGSGIVFKRNNVYRRDERPAADSLKRHEGNSNGYHYQKKQEMTIGESNGHQKKQVMTTNDTNGHMKKEDTNNDGWQIVRRPNGHKQNNVNHRQAPREGNVGGRGEFNNADGSETKMLEDKQHQDESGEKGDSGGIVEKSTDNVGKGEKEYRGRNGGNGRANQGGYSRGGERGTNRVSYQRRGIESAAGGEENGKSSEPTELVVNEREVQKGSGDAVNAGPKGDETASKGSSKEKNDKVPSQKEIERMERLADMELDAKKMTLKEYEKKLEEKRKVLESLKTEERRVALDKELESMHIVEKKKEDDNSVKLNSASDKLKKKVVNHKADSNGPKVRSYLFRPPTGGRGGRYPSRNGTSEGADVEKPAAPLPSFEDANQFPALA